MDRPLSRRRHPDPHIRIIDLSCGAEHAAGGESAGLGATLTTLYLQFEKEAEAALGLPPGVHAYARCRSATPWDGSGQSAILRSRMSSTKIDG